MASSKYEWDLTSTKRWYKPRSSGGTNTDAPLWYEKEKIIASTDDNLTFTREGSWFTIKHNNEVIEAVGIPVPGSEQCLTVTVGGSRDSIALFTVDETGERRMSLQFGCRSDPPLSAVNNCMTCVQHLGNFVPIHHTPREPSYPTVFVQEVLRGMASGRTLQGGLPAGEFLPSGFTAEEALEAVISDVNFPEMMAAIHKVVENLETPHSS